MLNALTIRLLASGRRCPQCRQYFYDATNNNVIKEWGKCLGCDKLELEQPFYSEEMALERE